MTSSALTGENTEPLRCHGCRFVICLELIRVNFLLVIITHQPGSMLSFISLEEELKKKNQKFAFCAHRMMYFLTAVSSFRHHQVCGHN